MGIAEISASAVGIYLEARPAKLEKSNHPPDTGVKDKHRGESKPPVPGTAYAWMDGAVGFSVVIPATAKNERMVKPCDRFTAQVYLSTINATAESYRTGIERHGRTKSKKNPKGKEGVLYSVAANMVWDDPTCVSTWRDGRTPEARSMARAFDALCGRVARDFGQIYPDVSMFVELDPSGGEEEGNEKSLELPSRIPRETRKSIVREEYREIVARIESLEARGAKRRRRKCVKTSNAGGRRYATRWLS